MEPCPNCGVPTRSGAKFCTSCGYRLSDPDLPPAEADAAELDSCLPNAAGGTISVDAGPFRPTEPDSEPAERSSPPTEIADRTDAPEAGLWGAPPTLGDLSASDPAVDPVDPPADQVLSSSWPAPSAASWPQGWGAIGAPDPASSETETAWVADQVDPADQADQADHVWPSFPIEAEMGDDQNTRAADAGDDEPDSQREEPGERYGDVQPAESPDRTDATALAPDSGGGLPPAMPLSDTVPAPPADVLPAPADAAPADTASPAPADASPALTDAAPPAPSQAESPDPVDAASLLPDEPPPSNDRSDVAARAAALVDELRSLLPSLASKPDVDPRSVADDLETAQRTGSVADDDLVALRAAAVAARDRPRDLDALVDVAARAEAVLALADAYDRLSTAISGAVDALRQGTDDVS